MEMRSTEQLLSSTGLMAFNIDSLKNANDALRSFGPESFHGDRITVQKKAAQESAIRKHNVHVSSMSGDQIKWLQKGWWSTKKIVGLGNFWTDLEILEAIVMSHEVLFLCVSFRRLF